MSGRKRSGHLAVAHPGDCCLPTALLPWAGIGCVVQDGLCHRTWRGHLCGDDVVVRFHRAQTRQCGATFQMTVDERVDFLERPDMAVRAVGQNAQCHVRGHQAERFPIAVRWIGEVGIPLTRATSNISHRPGIARDRSSRPSGSLRGGHAVETVGTQTTVLREESRNRRQARPPSGDRQGRRRGRSDSHPNSMPVTAMRLASASMGRPAVNGRGSRRPRHGSPLLLGLVVAEVAELHTSSASGPPSGRCFSSGPQPPVSIAKAT